MSLFNKFSVACLLCLSTQAALASHPYTAYARVINAQPVYQNIEQRTPQKHCWVETVRTQYHHKNHSATPVVVGSVIGGAIGHAVGHGHKNKKIGTAVGAILGAAIGTDISHNSQRQAGSRHIAYKDVERCEIRENISTYEQLVGYDVTYQYSGQRYTTHMRQHPGDRIKVAVDVRPVGY